MGAHRKLLIPASVCVRIHMATQRYVNTKPSPRNQSPTEKLSDERANEQDTQADNEERQNDSDSRVEGGCLAPAQSKQSHVDRLSVYAQSGFRRL